ncbi:hypothetical protein LCGC14_2156410 [marine sediment metagenome]|uniref:Uncharacterized protein n=1 Tax=marine sediment metagenome TaxID=412755 RepID=A0A0F9GQE1_9ZZZZ
MEYKEILKKFIDALPEENKNMKLFRFIEERETLCDICKLDEYCQHNFDYECKETDSFF